MTQGRFRSGAEAGLPVEGGRDPVRFWQWRDLRARGRRDDGGFRGGGTGGLASGRFHGVVVLLDWRFWLLSGCW